MHGIFGCHCRAAIGMECSSLFKNNKFNWQLNYIFKMIIDWFLWVFNFNFCSSPMGSLCASLNIVAWIITPAFSSQTDIHFVQILNSEGSLHSQHKIDVCFISARLIRICVYFREENFNFKNFYCRFHRKIVAKIHFNGLQF